MLNGDKMRLSHLFWGILLVTIGILFLLNNFTPIYLDWESLINLWPLAFIFWGISIILKENRIVRGLLICLVAIILAFCIFSTYKFIADNSGSFRFNDDSGIVYDSDSSNSNKGNYMLTYSPNIKNAELKFDGGAGLFKIAGETDNLFDARVYGRHNAYDLNQISDGQNSEITFHMKNLGFRFGIKNKNKNDVNIRLNTNPAWDINFDAGAADMDFDLALFKVRSFKVDMGAAKLKLRLGNLSDTTIVKVDGGAAKIEIYIPDSSACEISTENFFSSNHFEGFHKIDSGLYRTSNFNTSPKKIFLKFDTGFTSLTVDRY
jgi:LiaI-LiaF-like transmembrane region